MELAAFPATLKVEDLQRRHPRVAALQKSWQTLDLLKEGGEVLRANATDVLRRRPKESWDLFQSRLSHFTYQNVIGSCLGWYTTKLFAVDPVVEAHRPGQLESAPLSPGMEKFLNDCNRAGTPFFDYTVAPIEDALLTGFAWMLIDKTPVEAKTLAEQESKGGLSPYVVHHSPRSVINWRTDRFGALEWVILHFEEAKQASSPFEAPRQQKVWLYYDRQRWARYEKQEHADVASLVNQGRHALAEKGVVPFARIELKPAMQFGNRSYLHALSHLNAENALEFAIFTSCLAIPIIITDAEIPNTMSEVGALRLPIGSEFSFAEQSGVSFDHMDKRLKGLREEIYRQWHLIAQGRDTSATPASQSGYSKELDMAPSQDMLEGLGDVVREFLTQALRMAAWVMGDSDDTEYQIRGFDFSATATQEEVDTSKAVLDLEIPSDTLRKELQKKIALRALGDVPAEIAEAVKDEIDKSPTLEEQQKQRLQERMALSSAAFQKPLNQGE